MVGRSSAHRSYCSGRRYRSDAPIHGNGIERSNSRGPRNHGCCGRNNDSRGRNNDSRSRNYGSRGRN